MGRSGGRSGNRAESGTITLGNRRAAEFVSVRGTTEAEVADAAQLSSLADETPGPTPAG
ncbi:hypothetical protein ABT298_12130 [Streptomyces sp. NPDC001034]|uniref:hypothetical protein n=1 Tax=Streptomyces sp. NPDC001034 TaxID=3154375 RepID=UPI003326F6B2